MDGAAFQKHQRSGRRAKRLRSSGHLVSCSGGPLRRGSHQWINVTQTSSIGFAPQQRDVILKSYGTLSGDSSERIGARDN
jgi:hypothetical protein